MQTSEKRGRTEYTIDLTHVLKSVWRWAWAILLAGILVAVGAFSYATFVVTPQYSSQVRMAVQNQSKTEGDGLQHDWGYTASELAAARDLVATYMVVLKGHTTMEQVIEHYEDLYGEELGYTPGELASKISMGSVGNTEILEITVTVGDSVEAARIANVIADVLPQRMTESGYKPLMLVDAARVNPNRVSPSRTKYSIVGFIAGSMVVLLGVVIFAITDRSIHDDEYLLKTYNYPILAKVPSLVSTASPGNSYIEQANANWT